MRPVEQISQLAFGMEIFRGFWETQSMCQNSQYEVIFKTASLKSKQSWSSSQKSIPVSNPLLSVVR